MRIAVDVMGGDHAPDEVLKGCLDVLKDLDAADTLVLIGHGPVIREVLSERGIHDPRLEIEHTPDVIGMDESPAKAVRAKPDSSIVRMAHLGSTKADHRAHGVMSAGNTGACVSAAIMQMKRLRGVHRPGIAVTIPTFHGPVVLSDAGANPEPLPSHLWQYALMSDVYARRALHIASPRVAIMNIGSEEGKGSDLVRQAAALMRNTPGLNFIGNVEGRELFSGAADVIITDGFTGNTLLKTAEGLFKSVFEGIATTLMENDPDLAVRFDSVVRHIFKRMDYHETGGAPLLGVDGHMMIAHGSSVARSIAAAIRNTKRFAGSGVNEAITARLAEVGEVHAA